MNDDYIPKDQLEVGAEYEVEARNFRKYELVNINASLR